MQLNYDSLRTCNRNVNEAVTYTPDAAKYGRPDWWADALDEGNAGDCDDYAIAKLRKLLAAGWPRAALKIGLCWVETGEYHCVLVATFEREDWVLDNRYPLPMRWEMVPYKWDKLYSLGDRTWRAAA